MLKGRPLGIKLIVSYWLFLAAQGVAGIFGFYTTSSPTEGPLAPEEPLVAITIVIIFAFLVVIAVPGLLNRPIWAFKSALATDIFKIIIHTLGIAPTLTYPPDFGGTLTVESYLVYWDGLELVIAILILWYLLRPATRNYLKNQQLTVTRTVAE